jgi:hypothetical protein
MHLKKQTCGLVAKIPDINVIILLLFNCKEGLQGVVLELVGWRQEGGGMNLQNIFKTDT